jgi:uncharacterized protein (DUF2147 family)
VVRAGFIALIVSIVWATAASASSVDGTWKIRNLVLEISTCNNHHVCGVVAWTGDVKRRAADCHRTIVWGLSPDNPSSWSGGSIFDPTDGKTYDLSASLQPDGTLQARIYRGVPWLGKTEILRRVKPRSLDGWC